MCGHTKENQKSVRYCHRMATVKISYFNVTCACVSIKLILYLNEEPRTMDESNNYYCNDLLHLFLL